MGKLPRLLNSNFILSFMKVRREEALFYDTINKIYSIFKGCVDSAVKLLSNTCSSAVTKPAFKKQRGQVGVAATPKYRGYLLDKGKGRCLEALI